MKKKGMAMGGLAKVAVAKKAPKLAAAVADKRKMVPMGMAKGGMAKKGK